MLGIVYVIICTISKKKYIGQTVRTLQERWEEHCKDKRMGCRAIANSIKKYGRENFEIKILCKCNSIDEMNHREQYYIKLFNTISPNGYNLSLGGKNGFHCTEMKKKLSESKKGPNNPFFGKTLTKEHKANMSKSLVGRKHSQETKNKISRANMGDKNPNFGKKQKEESIQKRIKK